MSSSDLSRNGVPAVLNALDFTPTMALSSVL
jgi:hypothetical protein